MSRQNVTPEDVRRYVLQTYIIPSRRTGQCPVAVKVGNVQRGLGAEGSMALVATPLGTNKFYRANHLMLVRREGPMAGAETVFVLCWCGRHQRPPRG